MIRVRDKLLWSRHIARVFFEAVIGKRIRYLALRLFEIIIDRRRIRRAGPYSRVLIERIRAYKKDNLSFL